MTNEIEKIGMLLVILGIAFGIGYIAAFVPNAINGLIQFAKDFWWVTIIIGILIIFYARGGKKR